MAFDYANKQTILFGGAAGNDFSMAAETWEWNGQVWNKLSPADSPPARTLAAMACDTDLNRIVLFGGIDANNNQLNDTWEWDGSNWKKLSPNGPIPPARHNHAMAYDANRKVVVLFGGNKLDGHTDLQDTWELKGNDWTQNNSTPAPPRRTGHCMAYDSAHKMVILFGGVQDDTGGALTYPPSDTWGLDATGWRTLPNMNPPPSCVNAAMASIGSRVIMFGGLNQQMGNVFFNDTWSWNGSKWSKLDAGPTLPDKRYRHAIAYDPTRSYIVLFGGFSGAASKAVNDTWELRAKAIWPFQVPF